MSACDSFRQDFDACRDQTLPRDRQREIGAHLAGCETCRRHFQHASDVEAAIRDQASSWQPSHDLWHRIKTSIDARPQRRLSPRSPLTWMTAAVLLLAVSVTSVHLFDSANERSTESIASALVNEFHTFVVSHRPLDLSETQPARIRSWFGDKVEFRVPLPVHNTELKLAGGRLCNMFDQRIASFMYQVDDAWVSLYIMRSPRTSLAPDESHQLLLKGYGFIDWEHEGLYYSLVGDLPLNRLRQIAVQLRATRILTRTPTAGHILLVRIPDRVHTASDSGYST